MLYYIIPPIIIVVSTSILIYFLFRKAQEMPAQNNDVDAQNFATRYSDDSKIARLKDGAVHFWLKVLERVMHRAKLMALKFHNISNERFHAIRKKRQEIIEQEKEDVVKLETENILKDVELRNAEYRAEIIEKTRKEEQEPLVKQEIVRPDVKKTRMVAKNQLEDALIKRIAVNPRDIEAYERLGDYYVETANNKDALECFRQVTRLNPSHHKAKLQVRRIQRMMLQ